MVFKSTVPQSGPLLMYVAFLRAVNLGRTRKFPKDDLRRVVESIGFTNVQTFINTGNLRFTTALRSTERVRAVLEQAFLVDRGFGVPTIVFSWNEFGSIVRYAGALMESHPEALRHYVDLLQAELPTDAATLIEASSSASASFLVRGRAVHTVVHHSAPVLASQEFSRLLGVTTNRTANVLLTMTRETPPR